MYVPVHVTRCFTSFNKTIEPQIGQLSNRSQKILADNRLRIANFVVIVLVIAENRKSNKMN